MLSVRGCGSFQECLQGMSSKRVLLWGGLAARCLVAVIADMARTRPSSECLVGLKFPKRLGAGIQLP
jgi:hypothetical protein